MNLKKTANLLSPLEREILPLLNKYSSLSDLQKKSGLKEVEVMRALQWLSNKQIIELKEELKEVIKLDENGRQYLKDGLPEKRFLNAIKEEALTLDEIKSKANLSKEEVNACLGILRKKNAINIGKDRGFLIVSINENGKKMLEKESLEALFLKLKFPFEIKDLTNEEKYAFEELKKRKDIIKADLLKLKSAHLTPLGKKIIKIKLKKKSIDTLDSSMLKSGSWKGKDFRSYDISINVPRIYGGKRHFVKESINYIRKIMLSFGFKEMTGPLLQTSFWNFDALFTAQDHPVRELQDTFYIKDPEFGKLPKNLVNKIRLAHEKGIQGSTGWQYKWSENEAKKNVLRTHTTVLSARTLAKLKKTDLPAKFFAIGRCFRNETLDWSHLFEFNQFEGIVVGDVNFRDHIGFLREFFKRLGFEKARFRPAYFPYVEPGLEIDVFHPVHKKWIELGGTGILRPEVVVPLLGEDIPVLAWGPGFDRIIMDYYNVNDMRELYKNDLKKNREVKSWLK